MAAAAQRFLAALAPEHRAAVTISFDDANRQDWHYIPRSRRGIARKELAPEQRELGDALVRSALSDEGFRKAAAIRSLDRVLYEESRNPIRDEELYFFSVFGRPGAKSDWGWRLEGHHLSLNFTLRQGRLVSTTPFFFGANPAIVRDGPSKGLRVLRAEEEMGRALARSLNAEQRAKAQVSAEAPPDILASPGRSARLGGQQGLPASEMSPQQARALLDLIEMYARRLRRELAEAELATIRRAGMEKLRFAWAGGAEPGQPHYYRILGPTFVIEYDNTQNNANHIHTVWRDLEHDFGLDPLRAHYATSPHHAGLAHSAASPATQLHRIHQRGLLRYTR